MNEYIDRITELVEPFIPSSTLVELFKLLEEMDTASKREILAYQRDQSEVSQCYTI